MVSACVFLANGFEDIEGLATVDILRRGGVDVTVAGVTGLEVSSSHSLRVKCDVQVKEVGGRQFDCLVLPGGLKGSENCAADEVVQKMLREQKEQGRWIAGICAAPALALAKTGVMGAAKGTCYPGIKDEMGANYVDTNEPSYVDREHKIITSKGPATAPHFAFTVLEAALGIKTDDVKKAMLFDQTFF